MRYAIATYILMAVLVSFLGFVVEDGWLALTKGYIDNRNMHLPFLFGYGIAMVGLYLILGTPATMILPFQIKKKETFVRFIIYFVLVMLAVSVGEIILGTLVEKVCHFYWWDYTVIPLHITRYTSVPTSLGFALIITTFMDKFCIPILDHLAAIPAERATVLAWILGVSLSVDMVYSMYKMYRNHGGLKIWKKQLPRHSYLESF